MEDNSKFLFVAIFLVFVVIAGYMANIMNEQKKVIEAYQESLMACEKETIGDKILDKIRERNND